MDELKSIKSVKNEQKKKSCEWARIFYVLFLISSTSVSDKIRTRNEFYSRDCEWCQMRHICFSHLYIYTHVIESSNLMNRKILVLICDKEIIIFMNFAWTECRLNSSSNNFFLPFFFIYIFANLQKKSLVSFSRLREEHSNLRSK